MRGWGRFGVGFGFGFGFGVGFGVGVRSRVIACASRATVMVFIA